MTFKRDQFGDLNSPILAYFSPTTAWLAARFGASSTLSLVCNGGIPELFSRTAATPVTVDLSAGVGLGGLDVGAEIPATWYYIYAVPVPGGNTFDVVASISTPAFGPVGYASWRYMGAIRNDAAGNIRIFDQIGPDAFFSADPMDAEIVIYAAAPLAGPGVGAWINDSVALQVVIPHSVANAVYVEGYLDNVGLGSNQLWVDGGNPPVYNPTGALGTFGGSFLTVTAPALQSNNASRWVPVPAGTISHWWDIHTANSDVSILGRAWRDKYLATAGI